MIQNEREIRHEYVLQAVRQMMTAARTAPKGKGIDIIEVAMVTDEDIKRLSEELVIMSGETGLKYLGIAVGSACATASDLRLDTRVMFSAGMAAQRLGMLGDCKCVMAIPVSASSKNPFFDRKPKTE